MGGDLTGCCFGNGPYVREMVLTGMVRWMPEESDSDNNGAARAYPHR